MAMTGGVRKTMVIGGAALAGAGVGAGVASRALSKSANKFNEEHPNDGEVYRRDAKGKLVPFKGKTSIGKAGKAVLHQVTTGEPVYAKGNDGKAVDISGWSKAAKKVNK